MSGARVPGSSAGPPEIRRRVGAMSAVLLVVTAMLLLRSWWLRAPTTPAAEVVVEVRGAVPSPGFYPVPAPARARAALAAAGIAAPEAFVDAELPAGTALWVEGAGYRVEPMRDRLVFGLPIDLNLANAQALEAIPGVGPSRAAAIVAEREAGGPFAAVDELVRVHGIGPATVEELRPFVSVGP